MIRTERLTMIPVTQDLRATFSESRSAFARLVDTALPDGWPELPHHFASAENEPMLPWCDYLLFQRRTKRLVGSAGFFAAPDEDGDVEFFFEIAPAFRGNGYATETAEALIDLATANGARFVFAKTVAGANAPASVARKIGMEVVDDDYDPKTGLLFRFRIACDPKRTPLGNMSLRLSA